MFKFKVFGGHRGQLTSMIICSEYLGTVRAWTLNGAYKKAEKRWPHAMAIGINR